MGERRANGSEAGVKLESDTSVACTILKKKLFVTNCISFSRPAQRLPHVRHTNECTGILLAAVYLVLPGRHISSTRISTRVQYSDILSESDQLAAVCWLLPSTSA